MLQAKGIRYTPTKHGRFYSEADQQIGCGAAPDRDGAVLLPERQAASIIDPKFFNELSQRFGARRLRDGLCHRA